MRPAPSSADPQRAGRFRYPNRVTRTAKPRALRPGDNLRLVSPASPITPEKIQRFAAMIEEAGYGLTLGNNVFATDSYLAGADLERAQDLEEAFADDQVHAVMCARGGYGCARLMPHLDLDAMAASGKMFLGFSDITTLHIALNRRGLATVHAPMAISFSVDREPWVYQSFLNTLKGEDPIIEGHPKGITLVPGKAEGLLTGGCLCLLTDSLSTPIRLTARARSSSSKTLMRIHTGSMQCSPISCSPIRFKMRQGLSSAK